MSRIRSQCFLVIDELIFLGKVFAITGGLAAPALAAGIGGIAALTGATTASSTALLAVLATFKAGAALFGVGGGMSARAQELYE